MAKALNQNFFTATLYGSQDPNGTLTLQSTSSVTLGEVQVVGASLDLVIGGYVGSFVHTNTADRIYTLPDYDGTLLAGGLYTLPNQIAYSLAANSVTVLNSVNDAVLTTDPAGVPTWLTGSTGDYLQLVAGAPVFAPLPDNGSVALGTAQELTYYAANGNDVSGLATTLDRVLLSPLGNLTWGLITAEYLSDNASNPLGDGTVGQKLKSNGDGTFYWDNDTFVINPGTQYFVTYYTQPGVDTEVGSSGFLEVDETTNALKLNDAGSINFYEDISNGLNYIALKAPSTVTVNQTFTLPGADGLAGHVLSTDGLGNLVFSALTFGTVSPGVINDIAYYAASGTTVSGLTTPMSRALLSTAGSAPSWGLVTTGYLADTGLVPLAPGTVGEVLSSNGDGTFSWLTAAALSEEKRQGSVVVPSGAGTVTVLYDDPFALVPKVVMAQWSLEGASLPATMPVISVAASDLDGFTLQLSTTTTQAYLLYWYVAQDGTAVTTLPYVYLAGGDAGGIYQTAIQYFSFMTDTTIATVASIPTAVGYTQTTASATYGFINGGQTGLAVSVDTVYSFNYTTATVALEFPTFAFPRSSGAGVGTKDNGYVCGGEDVGGPTTHTNIEKIAHATVAISPVAAALTGSNTACGSATSRTHGYIALADGTVDKFEYTSETIVNNPGFTANAQVGCNDIIAGVGYFGTSAGDLQSYDFATDTVAVISTPGFTWSSAANSLTHGFFTEGGGSNVAYRFSFATGVLSASGVIGFNAEDASISTFQSKGIL